MTFDMEFGDKRYVARVERDGSPSEVHILDLHEAGSPDVQVVDAWVEAAVFDAAADAGV